MISYARKRLVSTRIQCKESVILLSVLWTLGLVCGLYFVSSTDSLLLESIYMAASARPSFFGILVITLFPIAISAVSVYSSASVLIYLFCVLKAFCFSFVLCGVISVFGYSGWLIRSLLLFSDSCMVVLLFWLWYRILLSKRNTVHRDLWIGTAIAAAVGTIDYFLVSPYLEILMHYS